LARASVEGACYAVPRMQITLGPLLYHWPPERQVDFYARIADEAPVDEVYLGELACAKRALFMAEHWVDVARRLEVGGKTVIWSMLAGVVDDKDRALVAEVASTHHGAEVEANEATALAALSGRPHRLGQMLGVYNEGALEALAKRGARHVCLPVEVHGEAVAAMGTAARTLGMGLEVQVFGRAPLALSARCFSARSVGRGRKGCRYACAESGDGADLKTLEGEDVFAISGPMVLSHGFLNLAEEVPTLATAGVTHIRLAPQAADMVAVAQAFRAVVGGQADAQEAENRLRAAGVEGPFANGFFYHRPGHAWVEGLAG
jgi:collagenase-like PrtC family protease